MIKCYECLYNNDGICQNNCSFDLEDDNCLEFESRDTYDKGCQKGRAELIEELCNRHSDDNSWCEFTIDVIVAELEEIAQKLNKR